VKNEKNNEVENTNSGTRIVGDNIFWVRNLEEYKVRGVS